MSLLFSARKSSSTKPLKQSSEITKRDMSQRQKIIRKVQELDNDGIVHITTLWTVEMPDGLHKISFSRDNLHVWINGNAVDVTCYITDKGYDVDIFFSLPRGVEGHIYSDVEGPEMMNYLLIGGEIVATDYQNTSI